MFAHVAVLAPTSGLPALGGYIGGRAIPGHSGPGYSWSDPASLGSKPKEQHVAVRASNLNMMLVRSGMLPRHSTMNLKSCIPDFRHGQSFDQAARWRLAHQQQLCGTRIASPWIDSKGKEMTSYNIVTTCMRGRASTTGARR